MSQLRLRILGESVIELGGTKVEPTATHLFSLLLYLGVERCRQVPRSELCSLLFPDRPEEEASHNLRQLIYRSRKLGVPLQCSAATILLPSDAVLDDLAAVLAAGQLDRDRIAPGRLEVLPHYCPPTEPFSTWLETFRERVRPQVIRVLTRELGVARAENDWRSVETIATAIIELDRFNETATLGLAEALARIGSKRDALALLRQFEKEVGASSETLALPPRILARRIADAYAYDASAIETPMLGRDREMKRLLSFWSRAKRGNFTSVLLCGSEGIGKTRLATECAASIHIEASGAVIVTKRSPLDVQRPLSLFADTAKQLLALRGAAGCSPDTLAIIGRLTRTHYDQHSEDQKDPEYSNLSVRRAIVDLLDSILSERPLCVVVDDAEYLDQASQSLLQHLHACLATKPWLLLLTSRSGAAGESTGAARVRLGPLESSDAVELANVVTVCLGSTVSDTARERVVELAAGNPGHLRLLLSEVAQSQRQDFVPTDFVATVDARLSSLTSRALHVLQACALFGLPCAASDLSRLTGLAGYSLLSSIQELEDSLLITFGGEHFQCASGLIHDRVRAATTPGAAALLHLRAARHLERSVSRALPSQALSWKIAEHWHKAGVPQSALLWRQRCWQHLVLIGQPLAAVEGIRAALLSASSVEERAGILSSLALALRAIGDFTALAQVLQDRIALGNAVNDTLEQKSSLAFDLFEAKSVHSPDVQPLVRPLQAHLRNTHLDTTRRLRAARMLMAGADHCFDPAAAKAAFAQLRALRTSDPYARLSRLSTCLIYHTVFGQRADALACIDQIAEATKSTERSWERIAAAKSCHIAQRVVAARPLASDWLESAFQECEETGVRRIALSIAGLLSVSHFDDGCIDDSMRWGAIAEDIARHLATDESGIDFVVAQIDLALNAGELKRAHTFLKRLLTIIPRRAPGPRVRREMLVYKVRVDQFAGRATSTEEIDELLYFHERGSRLGRHDDNVEVLYIALRERGESEAASRMLRTYLTEQRRELRRCNYWLRTRTAGDDVWSEPTVKHLA